MASSGMGLEPSMTCLQGKGKDPFQIAQMGLPRTVCLSVFSWTQDLPYILFSCLETLFLPSPLQFPFPHHFIDCIFLFDGPRYIFLPDWKPEWEY